LGDRIDIAALRAIFADYEQDKKRCLGDAAVEPHGIKFKRFERR
jgi:hypothetical protein